MPTYNWQTWLAQWNQMLLHDADVEAFIDAYPPEDGITPAVITSGWLGYPAAADAEIDHLEARIGARLPPSYRQFLQVSNGFRQPDMLVHRLLRADEVDWLRVRTPSIIDLWLRSPYVQSGRAQPDDFQLVLPSALEISVCESAGSARYLLNPRSISADGEWEALYYAEWIPGVERFPSFWQLMQREYALFVSIHGG